MPTWSDLTAAELTATQLHDILRLRVDVFVVEQQCPYPDVDGLDLLTTTRHLLATTADGLAAYSRFLPDDDAVRLGRVVVAPAHRATGLGRELVSRSLAVCARHWPGLPVRIAAQAHLRDFYGGFGFMVSSEPYDEDGILHVDMQLTEQHA